MQVVKNRIISRIRKIFSVWIFVQIGFVFSANPGDIVITEFNFQSAGNIYEYIELYNTTDSTIDLHLWEIEIDDEEFPIDDPLNIDSLDYVVLVSISGIFQDSVGSGTSYCPSNIFSHFAPDCDKKMDDIYWLKFSSLSEESGEIKIFDNSSSSIPIDKIIYDVLDSAWSQIVGTSNVGKSAEFILDPDTLKINGSDSSKYAHILNDDGLNWRSSQHESEWLWLDVLNKNETGSPLVANFITPSIDIEGITYAGDLTVCEFVIDSTICKPPSDGIPGGYAGIKFTGSAINVGDTLVTLDALSWKIMKNTEPVDSQSGFISTWELDSLKQDADSLLNIFTVSLDSRSKVDKFLGKTDTTIYIKREINYPPVVDSINGLVGGTIEIFDDDSLLLYGFVTDTELCQSSDTSCTIKALYHPILYPSVYENQSPFLWIPESINPESINNLDSISTLETVFRPDSIDSLEDISANSIRDTLEFQLKATDPFGESDSQIVTIIVHNKNQKPVIGLDSTNISEIYLIAGYSFELVVAGNKIELREYDASGEQTDTTLVAEITDVDNDQTFTIYPQGDDCETGFEGNYCVTGNTISTKQTDTYENLTIPFIVDDGVPTPIEGFASDSKSDTVYLFIQKINNVTHTVSFDDSIIFLDDDMFHLPEDSTLTTLPEDSTLTTEIGFNIVFKLDSIDPHNVNWDSLQWSFDKLDSELEQRVFAYKSGNTFKIDSLSNNFNGQTGLKVSVADFDNAANSLVDSIIINIPIFIDQRNDTLQQFSLHTPINKYSIDSTTIDSVRETLYFRLPQDVEGKSNLQPERLRFQWDNTFDIDTDPEINQDTLLNKYYRLELVNIENGVITVLRDNINPDNCSQQTCQEFIPLDSPYCGVINDTVCVDIDFAEYESLDISGKSTYKWRVVAQNYWQDDLGNDPVGISQKWNMTDFKIDLLQPGVTKLDIIINDMYPGYYDLLWNSSEAFLTDSTFLSIREKTNQFSAISMLNPRRITDNLHHFTGIIPTDLTSVTITFDLQIRDNAMNSGEQIDKISYVKVSPDYESTLISPSDNVSITLSKYSVSEPVQIIITEENDNVLSRKNEFELIQITPTIHFYPKELTLNNPASIAFNMSDYISSEFDIWQLVIVQIIDNKPIQLVTKYSDHFITASINTLGDYAVFSNSTLEKPLPTKFELKMNYPNPFNPSTTIPIELPDESFVEVAIYNILGEKIVILSEGIKSSGYHNIIWNGTNQFGQPVSSGIYFVSVHFGQKIYHHKMMLLK